MMPAPDLSLLGLPRPELEALFARLGEKPFRARQVMRWLYGRGVLDPAAMTDLSVALRDTLAARADFSLPRIDTVHGSADGTTKWRLAVGDNQLIETVYIPEEGRGTLCVSSQVGCALNCSFCATGRQGFNRNLTAAEIIGQVVLAIRELGGAVPPAASPAASLAAARRSPVTNIVFMGMGEPLANYDATWAAVERARAEAELRESEARFRESVEIATVGVIFFDLEGRITQPGRAVDIAHQGRYARARLRLAFELDPRAARRGAGR